MKAVRIHEFGGPEVMKLEDMPRPEPKAGEVLIRIKAASANPVDYKTAEGKFPPVQQGQLPFVLGRDAAGVVEVLGDGVSELSVGDEVYLMLPHDRGAFAEWVAAPVEVCAPKPRSLDMVQAASVPLAALTAWQGLFDHGQLKTGQRVLIHGASGGVGIFAVQFARHVGAEIFATASAEQKAYLESIGATRAIDYKAERFEDIARDVDLVFDLVGGETQDRSWALIKRGGALICTVAEPDKATAEQYGVRAARYMAEPKGDQLAEIGLLIDAGEVRVRIDKVFPLGQAAEAERRLKDDHISGKVVLEVG